MFLALPKEMRKDFKQKLIYVKENWLNDIRFWILLFFTLRLYGITNAPLEMGHNWRQSLTNMIARNFLQIDNNILYPRIDVNGNKPGIMATEFPMFNYLIYIIAKIFGYAHWYGRLINLVISSIGIFYFYKIIKRFFSESLAFYAVLILLSSLWFAHSRKSMPDTFCISVVIIGIYYGLIYLYENKRVHLLLFIILSSLAVLCKIPAVYLLSVMAIPMFDKTIPVKNKIYISAGGLFVLLVMCIWYFYWDPYLLATYKVQLYFPRGLLEGFKDLINYATDTFEKFYFIALESFVAFGLFLAGLYFMIREKQKVLVLVFVIASGIFFLFMCKTGYVFSTHSYYIIPYVPIMALITGFAIIQIKKVRIRIVLITVILIEGLLNQQDDFRIRDSEKYKLEMEPVANKVTAKNDLVAINGDKSPQVMYFLNRRGWSLSNSDISNLTTIDSIKLQGCKYVFIDKNNLPLVDLSKSFKTVYNDVNFAVYSLGN